MEEDYYQALLTCGQRYQSLLDTYIDDNDYWSWNAKASRSEACDLRKFINEFIEGCDNKLPLMKLNRWLGYIQGSLIQWEITTVQTERDWTRPLFRPLDFSDK